MQLQVLDADVLGVEGAHHVGELGLALGQAHRRPLGRRAGLLAEAGQHLARADELGRLGGDDLEGRAADLGLERLGRALGHDPAVVDDPDPVRERRRPPPGTAW